MMLVDGARAVVGSLALTALSLISGARSRWWSTNRPQRRARSAVSFYRRGGFRDGHTVAPAAGAPVLFALLLALTIDPPASDPRYSGGGHRRLKLSRPRRSPKRLGETSRRAARNPGVPADQPSPARFLWRGGPQIRAGGTCAWCLAEGAGGRARSWRRPDRLSDLESASPPRRRRREVFRKFSSASSASF
jgi:hypothetical protein